MFADYKAQVVSAYKQKRDANKFSLNLLRPTPAKLRAECLAAVNERYLKKDENTLRMFFGQRKDITAYMQTIRKFDADKFKPLDNFLKGITNDTDDKNIELLAFLINFEPRPYQFNPKPAPDKISNHHKEIEGRLISLPEDTTLQQDFGTVVDKDDDRIKEKAINEKVINQLLNEPINTKIKRAWFLNPANIIIFLIIAVILSISIYISLHRKPLITSFKAVPIGDQKCMYWTGYQFQPVSCDQKHHDTMVVALDTVRLFHFRRVEQPDTITEASIGKLWYYKGGEGIEFYTDSGSHPIYAGMHLRPMSAYIWNKYIFKNHP